MRNEKLRLICKCGTIWPFCDMPVDVEEVAAAVYLARCPSCNRRWQQLYILQDAHHATGDGKTDCVYMETRHERGTKLQDS